MTLTPVRICTPMSCCQAAQTFPSGCACETSDAVSLMRSEFARIPLRRLSLTWYRRSRGATPLRVTVPSVKRTAARDFYVEINLYQLFGVGALAHRGLSPVRGLVRAKPLAYPALHLSAREGCPGHCDNLFTGQISSRLVKPSSSGTSQTS